MRITASTVRRGTGIAAVGLATALALSGCGFSFGSDAAAEPTSAPSTSVPTSSGPSTTAPTPSPTTSAPTTTPKPTTPKPKPTTTPPPKPKPKPEPTVGDTLKTGAKGAYVKQVQTQLAALGYWVGTPDGDYGLKTSQAVMALQKAAGIGRDGQFGPQSAKALKAGVRPSSKIGGTGVEIDKAKQLLLIVRGGKVTTILNTSTGSYQKYEQGGSTHIASTPSGTFSVFRSVNGEDHAPLGDLWRPRYFNAGIAVHGSPSIPGYPASHGCARLSNPAMDMIWASNLMPIGSRVVVY